MIKNIKKLYNTNRLIILTVGMYTILPLNIYCFYTLNKEIKNGKITVNKSNYFIRTGIYKILWYLVMILYYLFMIIMKDIDLLLVGPFGALLAMTGYYVVLAMMSIL